MRSVGMSLAFMRRSYQPILARIGRLARTDGYGLTLILVGGLIGALLLALSINSPNYEYGYIPSWGQTLVFVGILAGAGVLYVLAIRLIPKIRPTGRLLAISIVIGLLSRLVFFGSTPMFEDDWYRYLWDGAVVSQGINPYATTPAQALPVDLEGNATERSQDPVIAELQVLGEEHPHYPERVNYPYVVTIYPMIAQAAFAGAHLIGPFNLDAFRLVLLSADIAAISILVILLRFYGRNPLSAMLYWWNPLVIVTAYNAAHMDILLTPFLLAALALAEFHRPRFASVALALAAGVKLWPIVLTPIIFRRWRRDYKELVIIGSIFVALVTLFIAPLVISLMAQNSGLGAYAKGWVTNSFVFTYLSALSSFFVDDGGLILRMISAGFVGAVALWFALSRSGLSIKLPAALMLTVLSLYFVSPTGYPWYAIWFLLFTPFAPSIGVALVTVTLPIYYLRYLMTAHGWETYFNFGLTPIEFGVPLVVLFYELRKRSPWRD